MFRFALTAPRLGGTAIKAISVLRHQSYAATKDTQEYGKSGSGSSNYAQQGNRRPRVLTPTWLLPRFELHDVRDDPAEGSMTRIAVDGKQLLVSQYPQLGPRKLDPNDLSPQFDRDRRISMRMRHMDLAGLVAVVENRVPHHHMKNTAFDLVFEKTHDGYALRGHVRRVASTKQEEWSIFFKGQFAITMEQFLENALTESFGFSLFHRRKGIQQEERPGTANSRGGGGSTNSDTWRRGDDATRRS